MNISYREFVCLLEYDDDVGKFEQNSAFLLNRPFIVNILDFL